MQNPVLLFRSRFPFNLNITEFAYVWQPWKLKIVFFDRILPKNELPQLIFMIELAISKIVLDRWRWFSSAYPDGLSPSPMKSYLWYCKFYHENKWWLLISSQDSVKTQFVIFRVATPKQIQWYLNLNLNWSIYSE